MASLSNSINIHCADCTNEVLNNSIQRKCNSGNENFDKNDSLINKKIIHKQKM